MVLIQKCIGCGEEYGEKGTNRNGGITGGVCPNCNIKRMEITLRYLENMVEAFPYDNNHKIWVNRVGILKKELTLSYIKRQERTK